ncbi:protein arginine N-methyltransferase 1 [Drosophila montana]|uniref:protein arginine N-methyltransferase 1 n=1 Tax=Drosophila montana TaxID=40370 RepID=UPI00313B7F91
MSHHVKNSPARASNDDSRRKKQKTFTLSDFHTFLEREQAKVRESKAKAPTPAPAPAPAPIPVAAPAIVNASNKGSDGAPEKIPGLVNGSAKSPAERVVTFAATPQIQILSRPTTPTADTNFDSRRGRGRGSGRVRSCPRIPTPPRCVPHELETVDRMTSADFRHDFAAHLENMRSRQKEQQHMHFFQLAIEENRHLFEGRTILVLSCGTGTLALMAARAGAARVYALDHSQVTDYARLVVRANKWEHIITVLHGRVANVELPQRVDGIMCNWMGQCLLYESELLELLEARDRWLKPNGFILPDLAALYLLGGAEQRLKNERCNWWLDVYGFNMNAMRRYALAEPRFVRTKGERLLTLAHQVLSLDLRTARVEDLRIDRDIQLRVQQEGYFECFVLYFDVAFSRAHQPHKLSCNPCLNSPLKSLWHQTLLFVEQPFIMRQKFNYTGHLVFKPKPNFHQMRIDIEFFKSTPDGVQSNPLVLKSWLLTPRFQTVDEVAQCQDRQYY